TFLTDQGAFSPRSCSYSAVSFILILIALKNWIVPQRAKNHSEINEEPFFIANPEAGNSGLMMRMPCCKRAGR
ncbi:MAG: hypothetical protein Q7T21_08580, partial [Gallionella sp.]|nr:hypothetical protein [Gallionella sp.]